ncbi:hypothetical protein [uncultured Clostridium sp.]|jgi:hypothetical protein|uniref:hypothetical protein n=1 Tax=uncultured Clostridium sp. TaxID=59620 RepID=UPI0026217468|nr:hypothetical protein [uncultured Clostridium sp.]
MPNKHDNFGDIFFGFILSFALFILWVISISLTSDIPVVISKSNIIGMSILFVALTIIYVFYTFSSKQNLVNLVFLAIPLFLSIGSLSNLQFFIELAPMKITNFICAALPSLIFFIKYLINIKRALLKKSNA